MMKISYNFVRFFELVVQVLDNVDNVVKCKSWKTDNLNCFLKPCSQENPRIKNISLSVSPEQDTLVNWNFNPCFSLKQNILFFMSLFKANGKS